MLGGRMSRDPSVMSAGDSVPGFCPSPVPADAGGSGWGGGDGMGSGGRAQARSSPTEKAKAKINARMSAGFRISAGSCPDTGEPITIGPL
jgi:hypothetical protein